MMGGAPDTLQRVAAQCGAIAWTAAALFELEGRLAAGLSDDGAVAHLAEHSRHHGWHAGLVADLLPDSPALRGAAMVQPPAGWVAALELAGGAHGDAARLAALYRALVPRHGAAIAEVQASCVGPGDAAIARVLSIVMADVERDLVGGGAFVAAALVDPAAVAAAGDIVSALDLAFVNR